MNSLAKIVAIIITIIAVYIAPMLMLGQAHDSNMQSAVYGITDSFVEQVREQGKITQDMYLEFISNLDTTDLLYNVEIVHCHSTMVPVFDENGNTIDTETVDNITYTDDILASVFETDGVYLMSKGDTISVEVTNREDTIGQKLRSFVFPVSIGSPGINVRDGGTIRDENY